MIYFAHALQTYNTEQESEALRVLVQLFTEELFNPNQPKVQRSDDPMQYCIDILYDVGITGLVFLPLYGRTVTAGVFYEIKTAINLKKPVFQFDGEDVIQIFSTKHLRIKR